MEQNISLQIHFSTIFLSSKYAFIFETSKNDNISSYTSTGMSEEKKMIYPYESDTDFPPKLNGSVSFLHKNVVNLYVSYKLDTWSKDLN